MADKDKIKEEIERRISSFKEQKQNGGKIDKLSLGARIAALEEIKLFVDSLPEEPENEDLEEEINNYIKDNFFGSGSMGFFSNRTKQELNSIDVANIASHFAEWQKQKDQETIELAEDHAMLAGMNKMKEEMMENAVEGNIFREIKSPSNIEFQLRSERFKMEGIKLGDKVKIIIVKEEQQ